MIVFVGWVALLSFAVWRAEEAKTRAFLAAVILVNLAAVAMMVGTDGGVAFWHFESLWAQPDTGYHAN